MRESHAEALMGLLVFIGFLIFAILLPFILKAFKKKTPPPLQTSEKPPSDFLMPKRRKSDELVEPLPPQDLGVPEDTQEIDLAKLTDHSEDTQVIEAPVPLAEKLKNTKSSLWGRLRVAFEGRTESEALDQVEEILFTSDIGPQTVENLLEKIRYDLKSAQLKDFQTVTQALKTEMAQMIEPLHPSPIRWSAKGPTVFLVVGVNGVGKTTTIGKLAALWAQEGKRVLVAAGDTFRAAAASQLKVWSERAQVEIFAPEHTKDPSGVAFEAVQKAAADQFDVVIVDTAGRLHTQGHLMEELKKIRRVLGKALEGAPHEAWIVLDANSGQNALVQAREFHQAVELTGAIVTKMDGTAKGGVIVGLHDELKLPVKKIGVGEKIEDLRNFEPKEFLDAIF
ncbi:MAG: signal recognition particle-docking protein FtsY [Bdellovibrionales bacterium]